MAMPINTRAVDSARLFRRAQWRTLLLVMFCYLFFYTGRQNFGFAARGMQTSLGLSTTALGFFNAALLVGYGLGQAINGNLGDLYGARRMVVAGAYLSVALNWILSWTRAFPAAVLLWGANGFAQSAAWPAMNRVLANWWPRRERGQAIGLLLLAAGFSSALTFLLCILVIRAFDWRWIFRLPVTLLLMGGTVYLLFARNQPEDEGFAPLPPEEQKAASFAAETSAQRYAHVLRNRSFLLACISIGCESIARYGLLNWVPVYFLGDDWRTGTAGLWITMALPLGMAAGALTAGLLGDRAVPENRSRVVLLFLGLAAIASVSLVRVSSASPAAGMVLLAVTGFLVYGPQAAYWAWCPDLVGRERAGTATGLMDAAAYGFAALGQVAIGWIIDVSRSTASAFVVIMAACILGAIAVLPLRK
ncbi:MAG TPA: MFS transporter [Bryobacteraceae bacterium]|nr:MFS transporter [Bryobacteraceae bacterium]